MSLSAPVDSKLDTEEQHVPPTRDQNGAGVADPPTNINRDIGSRTNWKASSPQTSRDIGSRTKVLIDAGSGVNKDGSSSVGELFQNRKRQLPKDNADANDPTIPPTKMEILGQVDEEFPLLDESSFSGRRVSQENRDVLFESSGDNIKLQKIIEE